MNEFRSTEPLPSTQVLARICKIVLLLVSYLSAIKILLLYYVKAIEMQKLISLKVYVIAVDLQNSFLSSILSVAARSEKAEILLVKVVFASLGSLCFAS